MAWKWGKPSMPDIRDVVFTVIRHREMSGFIARDGLVDDATREAMAVTGDELISTLERVINDGTYWHWTDGYHDDALDNANG